MDHLHVQLIFTLLLGFLNTFAIHFLASVQVHLHFNAKQVLDIICKYLFDNFPSIHLQTVNELYYESINLIKLLVTLLSKCMSLCFCHRRRVQLVAAGEPREQRSAGGEHQGTHEEAYRFETGSQSVSWIIVNIFKVTEPLTLM